jgi:hypothetical protein
MIQRRHFGQQAEQKNLEDDSLEQRLGTALTDDSLSAEQLGTLLDECTAAIHAAEQQAALLKEQIMYPSIYPDAKAAREQMENATFAANRLLTLNGRLAQTYQARCQQEAHVQYLADLEALRPKHTEVVRRFMLVADLIGEIRDTFQAAVDMDAECSALHGRAPAGEPARLAKVETAARSNGKLSLLKGTTLIDFDTSEQCWPPRSTMGSVLIGPMDARKYQFDCSGDWWRAGAAQAELKAKQDQEALAAADQARRDFFGVR